MYNEPTKSYTKAQLHQLEKYGLIITRPKLSIYGTMMNDGLKLIIENDSVILEQSIPSSSAIVKKNVAFENVDEWADELAIINRARNVLEKKLRGIVVNFIRFDSMNNKTKGSLNERLLKIIEEKERKKYKDLSAEQIIEKFLWSELTKLTIKEWGLFEKIFIDKNEFSLNSNIINDRIDAHAKDAGLDDIALYKRAVAFFEDKIRLNG